ncbi:MAG TPA: GNAT family N-acetyltransferase [Dehalococcoidia bacterium]|nr:GNAT family N-acetyltransferase [Dehalococcoidia bacterium]
MPVQPPRRLVMPAASLFDRMARNALSVTYSRREIDDLERGHPELVVERDGAILGALDHGVAVLPYSFDTTRHFSDHFDVMFEELLPRIRTALPVTKVRFRLTHAPSRNAVQATLKRLGFRPLRTWLQFSLAKADAPKPATPRGVKFRDGGLEDIDDIARIDHAAFPNTPMPKEAIARQIERHGMRVLLAEQRGRAVGLALWTHDDREWGYLNTLAVDETARAQGIGGALTLRVARRVFADGASRLDLRTEEDNAGAIRLYRSLGFRHTLTGVDFERPLELKPAPAEKPGIYIKFGRWR